MDESQTTAIEQEAAEESVLQQKFWHNGLSAPWLFTYALIVVQLITFPFSWQPGLPVVYVFSAANLSLATIVPIWWVVIRRLKFVLVGLIVLTISGIGLLVTFLIAVLSCVVGSWAFHFSIEQLILFMFALCWGATTVHLALLRRSGLRFVKKQPNLEIARSLKA